MNFKPTYDYKEKLEQLEELAGLLGMNIQEKWR